MCDCIVDIVQPDFMYNGGFIRWQFATLVPNTGIYQEHRERRPAGDWYAPQVTIGEDGAIAVLDGPGWGVTYDAAIFQNAIAL